MSFATMIKQFLLALLAASSVISLGVQDASPPMEFEPAPLGPQLVLANGVEEDLNQYDPELITDPLADESLRLDRSVEWFESHYRELVDGIPSLDLRNRQNSKLYLFGDKVFPVALTTSKDAVIAGILRGQGRVIFAGDYDWIYRPNTESQTKLQSNILKWLANGKEAPKIALRKQFSATGFDSAITEDIPISRLSESEIVDIYCLRGSELTDEEIAQLVTFVEGGGSLLFAAQAWSFSSDLVKRTLEWSGNKLGAKLGVFVGYYDWGQASLLFDTTTTPAAERSLKYAIDKMATDPSDAISSDTFGRVLPNVLFFETASLLKQSILDPLRSILKNLDDRYIFGRIAPSFFVGDLARPDVTSADLMIAKNASHFPGLPLEGAQKVTETITMNGTTGSHPGQFIYSQAGSWEGRSTGLYASPGEVVEITLPEDVVGKIQIQIGFHTDSLFHKPADKIRRDPKVVIGFPVRSGTMRVASPWGGIIYLKFPHHSKFGLFSVTVKDAIRAPRFVLGETTNEQWINETSKYPAPFAEIEAPGQIKFLLKSSAVRELTNLHELMTWWDEHMININNVVGFPDGQRPRMEFMVMDHMISSGGQAAAHSGYPISSYDYMVPATLNLENLKKNAAYLHDHEVGHNQQWKSWTIGGITTEPGATFLWTLARMGEGIYHYTPANYYYLHEWASEGRNPDKNQFDSRYTYLAQYFGTESYASVASSYYQEEALKAGEGEDINDLRWKTWAHRYVNYTKTNLCPFYDFYNHPLFQKTRDLCSEFPEWTESPIKSFENLKTDCPEGWVPTKESCIKIQKDKLSWFEAEKKCAETPGAHLASCLDQDEVNYIAGKTPKAGIWYETYWVGLSNLKNASIIQNLDGTAATVDLYLGDGQPSDNQDKRCGSYYNGKFYTNGCDGSRKSVCKLGPKACAPKVLPDCPEGWTGTEDACFKFVNDQTLNWIDAERKCAETEGATLASCLSSDQANFLRGSRLWTSWKYYWTGASDIISKDSWVNLDGSKVEANSLQWNDNEPTSGDTRHCGAVYNGKWNDYDCASKQRFICQKGPTTCKPTVLNCPAGWIATKDACFKYSETTATWPEAEKKCNETPGAHLASCITDEQAEFLTNTRLWKHWTVYLLGITDQYQHNEWENLDGSSTNMTNFNWKTGKPNTGDDRHCGMMHNGLAEDWSCTSQNRYLCKIGSNACAPKHTPTCPEGWKAVDSSCVWVSTETKNWFDAETECAKTPKAHLASCLNTRELNVVKTSVISRWTSTWLGISDLQKANEWQNLDGSEIGEGLYTWKTDQPRSGDNTRCGFMYDKKMEDRYCTDKLRFVCKIGDYECAPKAKCPQGWRLLQDKCYLIKHLASGEPGITWDDARKKCISEDASLLEVETQEENRFVESFIYRGHRNHWGKYWIGLVSDPIVNEKSWLSGEPVTYTYWNGDKPNSENGGVGINRWSGRWETRSPDDDEGDGYICEKPLNGFESVPGKYTPPSSVRQDCPEGWQATANSCFLVQNEEKTWLEAVKSCQEFPKAQLAFEFDKNEMTLAFTFEFLQDYWIGIRNRNPQTSWANIDNSGIANLESLWATQNPQLNDQKDCVVMRNANFENRECNTKNKYICKIFSEEKTVQLSCPEGWLYFQDSCYYKGFYLRNHTGPSDTFSQALDKCRAQGSTLAEIDSKDEHSFLFDETRSLRDTKLASYWAQFWFGLTIEIEGSLNFVSGKGLATGDFRKWCTNEPSANQEGGFVLDVYSDCWRQEPPTKQHVGYLCEKKADGSILAAYNSALSVKQDCPDGWSATPTSCIRVSSNKTTWWNAELECAKTGGAHMASCLTAEEFNLIKWSTTYYNNYWIGISNKFGTNDWTNINGSIVNASAVEWAAGFPDNTDFSDCGQIRNKKLQDGVCGSQQNSVCKIGGEQSCAPTQLETFTKSCPEGWNRFRESCYLFDYKPNGANMTPPTFDEANEKCKNDGANLVAINTETEYSFIKAELTDIHRRRVNYYWSSYWIGLKIVNGTYDQYTNGEEATFKAWCGNTWTKSWWSHGVYLAGNSYCYNDRWNSIKADGWICEKDLE